jgi:hypothetical protein
MLMTPITKIGGVLFLLGLTTIFAIDPTTKHKYTTKKDLVELDKKKLFSNT